MIHGAAYQHQYLDGFGDEVVESLPIKGPVLVNLEHTGTDNFIVWAYDKFGNKTSLIANSIGNYSGQRLLYASKNARVYGFEVTADGPWSMQFEPLSQAGYWSDNSNGSSFGGSGDQVIRVPSKTKGRNKLSFDFVGEDNFIVWSYSSSGKRLDLKANEIGDYSGTTLFGSGVRYLEIQGEGGSWTLTRTK